MKFWWQRRPVHRFRPSSGRTTALLVGAMLVVGAACSDDPDERAGDQPVTEDTTFRYGRFDELPRYPRSEPLQPPIEEAEAVSQSFKAEGATPSMILDFYARRLEEAGWQVIEPVHELGTGTVRARWADPRWILTVSSTTAPTLTAPDGAIQAYSQYSLSLRPADVPPAEGPPEQSAEPARVETAGFVDRHFEVTRVRDYDPIVDQTAFSFRLTGEGPADYVLVAPCRDVPVVFAVGPAGPPAASEPKPDPATDVAGIRWEPGELGTYTVAYEGALAAAEMVVKNGDGSLRVRAGNRPCANAPTPTTAGGGQ